MKEDGVLLFELMDNSPKEKIVDWEHIDITSGCRLYYKVINDNNGFLFHVVNFVSCPVNEFEGNDFENPQTRVETLQHGTAYFDGVRHLYTGTKKSDNEGYIYYPNMLRQIEIMKALRELELKYCWDAEKELY